MVRAGIKEAHPAGIWSDLSVDGPVIGTLVVVVDKAKNLPNRKKIGKQDPYVVCRIGKEAKRTDADVRGGQTPRWDKELRFPVRGSPDYRVLKLTVFNDDKKTDLIGECSVRLDKILVQGGGTDDGWRNLKCKDKYAGDIMVELTFWDMRPKEESVEEKRKRLEAIAIKEFEKPEEPPRGKLGGAREMKGAREKPIKRRPLPSNPTIQKEESKEELKEPRSSKRASIAAAPEPAAPAERARARRPRHSYHPESHNSRSHRQSSYTDNSQSQHNHSYSEPPQPIPHQRSQERYRSSQQRPHSIATPPRGMVMAPHSAENGKYETHDLYAQDNYLSGADALRNHSPFEDNEPPPPPPPPAHGRRAYGGESPAHHSPNPNFPSPQPSLHHRHDSQQQLRHYPSVPDWPQQSPTLDGYQHQGRSSNHRHSYAPPDQYGSSYPGARGNFAPQHHDEFGSRYVHSPIPRGSNSSLAQGGYDDGLMFYEDDAPGLSHGHTPSSSVSGSRNAPGGPPPPPPPHGNSPAPIKYGFDEPNWQNQHNQPSEYNDLGLPSYELSTQRPLSRSYPMDHTDFSMEARRPSVGTDMSTTRNGIQIPPSLIPGIDPSVAEELSERMETERRMSWGGMDAPVLPLQIHQPDQPRQNNYHRPQVEEVQDPQLYQPQLLPEDNIIERPLAFKKKRPPPIVKPMPIHGERDDAVPAIGATPSAIKRNSTLAIAPERKPVPETRTLGGLPFSPDSYDSINPNPVASLDIINNPGATYRTPQEADDVNRRRAAEIKRGRLPHTMITPGTNRVLDPSDVLPPESFAPEPEPRRRSPCPPPPVPFEHRKSRLIGRRSPSPLPPRRGERLALTAPPSKQVAVVESPIAGRTERERQRTIRSSRSMAALPSSAGSRHSGSSRNRYSMGPGAMVMYNPNSERELERQREREMAEQDARALVPLSSRNHSNYGYDSAPRYGGNMMELAMYDRGGPPPPPIPAKIPIPQGMTREQYMLTQEMSMISIGAGDGGRRRTRGY